MQRYTYYITNKTFYIVIRKRLAGYPGNSRFAFRCTARFISLPRPASPPPAAASLPERPNRAAISQLFRQP
jgi:hypothetical protein